MLELIIEPELLQQTLNRRMKNANVYLLILEAIGLTELIFLAVFFTLLVLSVYLILKSSK